MRSSNAGHSSGFTLLELLIVIVVIGILVGILLPAMGAVKKRALDKRCESEVKSLALAVRAYYTEKGEWPVPAGGTWYTDNNLVFRWLAKKYNLRRNYLEMNNPDLPLKDPYRSNLCYKVEISVDGNWVEVSSGGWDCVFGTGSDDKSARY